MFTVYYANQIETHKEVLAKILQQDPNPDPFAPETVLVQSLGMAQWLQMQLAETLSIAGNIQFPYPTSFLWQQYRLLFPELPKENIFDRATMVWRLMRLLPDCLAQEEFSTLANYLKPLNQLKQYQLACKIADLFDQYLVYRPHWLVYWENNQSQAVLNEIKNAISFKYKNLTEIEQNIRWQTLLWKALVADIKKDTSDIIFNTSHRAYLQQRYLEKLPNLTEQEMQKLPKRIFVFGISSLPQTQLAVLKALSQYCRIYLFFTNPSKSDWSNDYEDKVLEKLSLKQHLSTDEFNQLLTAQGNPLLATWGKQGKAFLNLLSEIQDDDSGDHLYFPYNGYSLLDQVKNALLDNQYQSKFNLEKNDKSIQIHNCHSKMREVEVLHNQLLNLFEQNPDLSPKDIIVMSADIDSYAPYINAVFSNYERQDPRFIPFTLSDQKISYIDPIIENFLTLLSFKNKEFSAEEILNVLNVQAIREKFQLNEENLSQLRAWIKSVGIRSGLKKENLAWTNYNSWQNGLDRLLLGSSLKSENNAWQDTIAFDQSYGLSAELIGKLAKFIDNLNLWITFIQQPHSLNDWQEKLGLLITEFYQENNENSETLLTLSQTVTQIVEQISQTHFTQEIDIEVLEQLFIQQLSEQRNNLNFLVGKVNFCTLLPMRAIPFKVVCLLGMNDGSFPRQHTLNNFDLMQYAPQKGDRIKRDDDRYLFLESLLSAQQVFYISYIGQSLIDNSEKYPSILVKQLVEYLAQRLSIKQYPIMVHPMTVFSEANLSGEHISYDKEWINARFNSSQPASFIQPIENAITSVNHIAIEDLITYIQSPVKWFFNHQLGIRFEQNDEAIGDTEPFTLSGLEKYILLDELLTLDLNKNNLFFENAKLQGELPAQHFAEISQNDLTQSIQLLQRALADYLDQEKQYIACNLSLTINGETIHLYGNLNNRFEHNVIQWRVGGLRDKDIIQSWIYYLVLKASCTEITQYRFYYRLGDEAKYLEFTPISMEEAQTLLIMYLNDYVASFNQLKWAVTDEITDYIKKTSTPEQCQTQILASEDRYIKRILAQGNELDYADIHQRTLDWFTPMINHINQ